MLIGQETSRALKPMDSRAGERERVHSLNRSVQFGANLCFQGLLTTCNVRGWCGCTRKNATELTNTRGRRGLWLDQSTTLHLHTRKLQISSNTEFLNSISSKFLWNCRTDICIPRTESVNTNAWRYDTKKECRAIISSYWKFKNVEL